MRAAPCAVRLFDLEGILTLSSRIRRAKASVACSFVLLIILIDLVLCFARRTRAYAALC